LKRTHDEREIKNWYDRRHRNRGENAWRSAEAYPVFLGYLNPLPGRKLLDVGCGTGFLLKAAAEMRLETYGIDISDEGVKIAKQISPDSTIIAGNGENLWLPDEFVDYITCIGALEHFLDIERGVNEMVRVAKPDATLCIVVPNANFIYWRLKRSKGTEQQDINETLMSLNRWKNIFTKAGLEVLGVYHDTWLARKIGKLALALLPIRLTYQFVFVLKKNKKNETTDN